MAAGRKISSIRLLAFAPASEAGFAKKNPDLFEVQLSGAPEAQLEFAEKKLGKELGVQEVLREKDFLDVKAVTIGKGTQGPVKRFGVKTLRPKAKKARMVGSIGPWNPSTVMYTVARPGQMGYHSRTEYNKKLLKILPGSQLRVPAGFSHYGLPRAECVLVKGSVPGPAKRAIALRKAVRPLRATKEIFEEVEFLGLAK